MTLALSTIPKGTSEQPRFILANHGKEYWTGEGWSESVSDAILFHSEDEVAQICTTLNRLENMGEPTAKFVAPVEVEVFGDDVDISELHLWLLRSTRLYVDYKQGAKAVLKLKWSELERVKK